MFAPQGKVPTPTAPGVDRRAHFRHNDAVKLTALRAQDRPAYVERSDGRCIVAAHGDRPMPDEAFSNHIREVRRIVNDEGAVCILMYSAGHGGPNAKQRASLRQLADLPTRFALVTDSAPMRALMTAITWFLKQPVRAFPVHSAAQALDFLELDAWERESVRRMVREVCAEGGFREPNMWEPTDE